MGMALALSSFLPDGCIDGRRPRSLDIHVAVAAAISAPACLPSSVSLSAREKRNVRGERHSVI